MLEGSSESMIIFIQIWKQEENNTIEKNKSWKKLANLILSIEEKESLSTLHLHIRQLTFPTFPSQYFEITLSDSDSLPYPYVALPLAVLPSARFNSISSIFRI